MIQQKVVNYTLTTKNLIYPLDNNLRLLYYIHNGGLLHTTHGSEVAIMRTWLKVKRQDRPQELIAKMAGISQQMYSKIERGEGNPSVDVAKRIAAVLGFDWTLFFEDPPKDRAVNL